MMKGWLYESVVKITYKEEEDGASYPEDHSTMGKYVVVISYSSLLHMELRIRVYKLQRTLQRYNIYGKYGMD